MNGIMNLVVLTLLVAMVARVGGHMMFKDHNLRVVSHKDEMLQVHENDKGTFTNCGGQDFSLTWSPKVVNPKRFVTIRLSMTSQFNWFKGYANYTVTIDGQSRSWFAPVDCSTAAYFIMSDCPFKKGEKVEGVYSGPASAVIAGKKMGIRFEILDSAKKMLFCGNATITTTEGGGLGRN